MVECSREGFIHTKFRSEFICIFFTELFREDFSAVVRTDQIWICDDKLIEIFAKQLCK